MASFIEEFMGSLGPEVTKQVANNLGIKKKTAEQIIPHIVPMILSGLRKQKDEHGGPERVDHILNKYGNPGVLDNIGDLISQKAREENPDPKLGGLLGDSGVQAANLISQKFGLNASTAMKLIPMLAPLVLGALSRKRDQEGAGTSGIAALLDQDGDGSILDDVAGFLMKGLFGGGGGGQQRRNPLGSILGSLFGRRG